MYGKLNSQIDLQRQGRWQRFITNMSEQHLIKWEIPEVAKIGGRYKTKHKYKCWNIVKINNSYDGNGNIKCSKKFNCSTNGSTNEYITKFNEQGKEIMLLLSTKHYLSSNSVSIKGNSPLLKSVPRTCFNATNNSCLNRNKFRDARCRRGERNR